MMILHRLADRETVEIKDLAGEHYVEVRFASLMT
jgi:hypothetical protein